MNSTAIGDKYEESILSHFAALKGGGDMLIEYCRRSYRHRVVEPDDFQHKRKILGGRSGRIIQTDVSFSFHSPIQASGLLGGC